MSDSDLVRIRNEVLLFDSMLHACRKYVLRFASMHTYACPRCPTRNPIRARGPGQCSDAAGTVDVSICPTGRLFLFPFGRSLLSGIQGARFVYRARANARSLRLSDLYPFFADTLLTIG